MMEGSAPSSPPILVTDYTSCQLDSDSDPVSQSQSFPLSPSHYHYFLPGNLTLGLSLDQTQTNAFPLPAVLKPQ